MAYQANDLFQLQSELVEAKVDIAVGKASDRIIERIETLRTEVHEINIRLAAVEAKLGMRNEMREQIRNRFIDYAFKAGWLLLATVVSSVFLYLHLTTAVLN